VKRSLCVRLRYDTVASIAVFVRWPLMHLQKERHVNHNEIMHARRESCIARRFRRDDLVDTVIGPVAAEAAAGSLMDMEEDTARVGKYLQRYQDVQRQRLNMQVKLLLALGLHEFLPLMACRAAIHCRELLCCFAGIASEQWAANSLHVNEPVRS